MVIHKVSVEESGYCISDEMAATQTISFSWLWPW